jgi:hypothetical protein
MIIIAVMLNLFQHPSRSQDLSYAEKWTLKQVQGDGVGFEEAR